MAKRRGEERSAKGGLEREERLLDERDNKENISRSQRDRHLASERERERRAERCTVGVGVERRAHRPSVIFRKKEKEGTALLLFDPFY